MGPPHSPEGAPTSSPLIVEPCPPPAPPKAYWGQGSRPAQSKSASKGKRVHGEASDRLKKMSTLTDIGRKVGGSVVKGMDKATAAIEIVDDDDDDSESDGGEGHGKKKKQKKYESTDDGKKRKQAEQFAQLKASRDRKASSAGPAPRPPAAVPATKLASPKKNKGKSKERIEKCIICSREVPSTEMESHFQPCFDRKSRADAAAAQADERAAARIATVKTSSPRPAAAQADTTLSPNVHAQLAQALFGTSSSPKVNTARSKGKGKAVQQDQDDEDEFGDQFDEIPDDEWEKLDDYQQEAYGRDVDPDEDEEEEYGEDEEEEEAEDDDSDLEIEVQPTTSSRKALGTVNASRRKGPPIDSSPPTGSIYISTMRKEIREGYERRYADKASPKRKGDDVQKMTATKKPFKPRGGFRGRGRRGGFRKRGGRK